MSVQLIPGRGYTKVAVAYLGVDDIEFLPLAPFILARKTTDNVYIIDPSGITVERIFADDYTNINFSATFVVGTGDFIDIVDIQGLSIAFNGIYDVFTWGDDTIWHPTPDMVFGSTPASDDLDSAVGDLWFGINNQGDGALTGGTEGDKLKVCVPFLTFSRSRGIYI